MKLIVGLGNPGPEYAQTRHNAGWMVIEQLALRHGMGLPGSAKEKFHAACREGQIKGERAILIQPLTYMNRSGLSVGEAVTFYKADIQKDLMILVDDLYIPTGRIRLRGDGGTAGHNGLADIEKVLGTKSYPRLRIGIDPPGRMKQVDYVLGRFTPAQAAALDLALHRSCDAIEMWAKEGLAKAMTVYNAE
jgi:PTH1 family peptidyl-tRNA hydrolase